MIVTLDEFRTDLKIFAALPKPNLGKGGDLSKLMTKFRYIPAADKAQAGSEVNEIVRNIKRDIF